jgi:hypothetical protein
MMYEPQSDFQDWCTANLRQIACSKKIRMLLAQAFAGGRVAEREACAKACEAIATETYGMTNLHEYGECAAAIRERKS